MPGFLVDPLNLSQALVGIAALVSAAYFARVKDKSASTWFIMGSLVVWAFYELMSFAWAATSPNVSTDSRFFTSALGVATIIVGGTTGPMLAQAAYRFRGNPFAREAAVILGLSLISISVTPLVMVDTGYVTFAVGVTRWLVAFWSLWGVGVIVRRRRTASGNAVSSRDRAGMVAVAAFLLVVAASETFYGFNLYLGSPRSILLSLIGLVFQYSVVLALPVIYVQYAPEPTTFQVKLVGFVLLVVLSVFGVINAYQGESLDEMRRDFDPAPELHTLSFIPAADGYTVTESALQYHEDLGTNLRLLDDEKKAVPLAFAFPFGGRKIDTVSVSANGAIEPTARPYPYPTFFLELPSVLDRPLIAAWYTDLNPGAGGSVYANALPDRLVVTWKDVPEWNFYLPHTVQAVLHESGRIDFNYVDVQFDAFIGAQGVLADPAAFDETASERLAGLVSTNPFRMFDRRIEFKQYMHRETMPFVRVVLGTIVIVLLVAPFFFRMTLTRPLNRLLEGMKRVNDGDLAAELQVGVKDEFGSAAEHFNQMTQSLRSYSQEMESLVAERTSELNASLDTLRSTQEQLVQQEKMASLGQLTAGIAHEIKNPLNFINNFAELNAELADELGDAAARGDDLSELIRDLRQNAHLIAEHGQRADGIVRSMMEHARTGASEKDAVDVNAFVEEYVNLAYHGRRAAVPDFNVTLERDYADDAGTAWVIRQDLGRVIVNLVSNAFDAVGMGEEPPTHPTVRIATRRGRSTSGKDRVVIEVSDNGPGVPDEVRQKIFEPFFTTKPTGKGTGLGLSLSYDIVTKGHGGAMTVDQSPLGGARFIVELPAS